MKSMLSYLIILLVCLVGTAVAQDGMVPSAPIIANGAKFEPLPLRGVVVAEKDNQIYIISENGRFQFTGDVIDKWSGKTLKTLSDASRSFNYLDTSNINFQFNMLAPYIVGHGPKVVTIFADPLCPNCARIFEQLPEDSDLYTFQIIPIGVLGEESIMAVKNIECAADQAQAKRALLTKTYQSLQQVASGCEPKKVFNRLMVSRLLGVDGVPYTIRDDGLIARGYPPMGFMNWLELR